jgi:NAD(P)H-hydrate epimerase
VGFGETGGLRTVGGLTYLTAEEMAEADRVAIEDFGLDVLSLMENAGVGVAILARRSLGGNVSGKCVACLIGKGNNGGDGLVAARHLHNWGASVSVLLGGEAAEIRDVPARQLAIVEKMGIQVKRTGRGFGSAELVVDALLGYGSKGSPRGPIADLIRGANESGVRILAVDIPSGMDATTGEPGDPCVVASATLTLGLPKMGFLNPRSREFVGELYLADISMPREIYAKYPGGPVDFGGDAIKRII